MSVKKEVLFWVLLLTLNFLLFLPGYLITSVNDVIVVSQRHHVTDYSLLQKLFYRFNFDVFRGAMEFTLLSIFFLYFKYKFPRIHGRRWVFWTYMVTALYLLYFQVSCLVFQASPLLFNDVSLIIETITLFAEKHIDQLMWLLGGLIVLFILIFYVIRSFWYVLFQVLPQRLSLACTILVLIFSTVNLKYGVNWTAQNTFIPVSIDFAKNIYTTLDCFKYVRSVNPGEVNNNQSKVSARYNSIKPNVYFIIVESYGEVLNTDQVFHQSYQDSLKQCESYLKRYGWGSVSSLSEAPNGGNSKVSYGSLMYGFNFENNGVYSYFYRSKKLLNTNHWGNHLKRLGYTNYKLDARKYPEKHKSHWKREKRFYGFDSLITYKDLNYQGTLVGAEPSALNQYVLGFGLQKVRQTSRKPTSLFYFSRVINRSFNDLQTYSKWKEAQSFKAPLESVNKMKVKLSKQEYLKAELYQLGYLTKTICEQGSKDDVFIVIGDHQPFFYTTFEDTKRTPIHIITKNKKVLKGFKKNGYLSGLQTLGVNEGTSHDQIYSSFMKVFYNLSK